MDDKLLCQFIGLSYCNDQMESKAYTLRCAKKEIKTSPEYNLCLFMQNL